MDELPAQQRSSAATRIRRKKKNGCTTVEPAQQPPRPMMAVQREIRQRRREIIQRRHEAEEARRTRRSCSEPAHVYDAVSEERFQSDLKKLAEWCFADTRSAAEPETSIAAGNSSLIKEAEESWADLSRQADVLRDSNMARKARRERGTPVPEEEDEWDFCPDWQRFVDLCMAGWWEPVRGDWVADFAAQEMRRITHFPTPLPGEWDPNWNARLAGRRQRFVEAKRARSKV
ncbi:hypothetical protein B0H15DRAFT_953892 [Mycena belliarum]|uniref:Uncharacterized protein n=1 Tax=Mycena belliarum TaxID=1033014 RepID=A0AAD6XJW7_9AGAR|nr:hypothetical protein B0H15DRAFT_953892 [Mycena belliae]